MDELRELTEQEIPEGRPSENVRARGAVSQVLLLLRYGDARSALALFAELHPADQGDVLAELSREVGNALLAVLTPEDVAKILKHLEVEKAVEVSEKMEAHRLSQVLDEARPDVAADILRRLPNERFRETLKAMNRAEEVFHLLGYADDTAGGLMTPQYLVVKDSMTAAVALDILHLLGTHAEAFSSVFVVDDRERLVGSLSITRLALAQPTTVVRSITDTHVVYVHAGTDQEECVHLMARYSLRHLPVVDEEHRLIGTIQVEDVVDVMREEATEDMYRVAGIAGERLLGPLLNSVRYRLPWLYINLATVFLAALVISLFESTIARVAALATFLPVIAGQGGIAGTQTITLVVRSMALGELAQGQGSRLLIRELLLGLINGVLLSLVVGLVAYLWKGQPMLGVIAALAMLGNMLVAGLTGAGVPLLLRRLHMDPAVSSAVFVTTFTDVVGFFLFLGMATALIRFLL
ncbi:MAG: Magnesium transporter MgtE [Dehalococcoidia bacterium]|nr:Magnesium transporter MgtE [Dehalococcoidia bacterium]